MRGVLTEVMWHPDPAALNPSRAARRPCRYSTFTPALLAGQPEALTGTTIGAVSEAEHAVSDLDALADPALAPLARLLLRTESIASSRIEGMQVSARALARAEARAETGRAPGPDTAEILANIDAMSLAVETAANAADIGETDLLAIHEQLMAAGGHPFAGQIRTQQNWIGGGPYNPCSAEFVPPAPQDVPGLMADLYAAINDDVLSPVVQAAIVHAQFETIHPFADGNGRVGRTLIHITFRRRGLTRHFVPPVSLALAGDRDRYIAGLNAYRAGDLDAWVTTFAEATTLAVALAHQYLRDVAELQESWRELLAAGGKVRADAAAWTLIDVLAAHPMITVPIATAATGRTKASVGAGLEILESAGVLTRVGGGARNRCWEAVGLLELIETLETRTGR